MDFDITSHLAKWEYEPGELMVRRFKGDDGLEKIQLRIDLGLLQMNAKGRPDGKKPFGYESYFDYYKDQWRQIKLQKEAPRFSLGEDETAELQQEALQYQHRYICFFQIEDYQGVLRDTERNLAAFDFVEKFARSEELAWALQQFRPQALMMRRRAMAALSLEEDDYDGAVRWIRKGIHEIQQFMEEFKSFDQNDSCEEVESLQGWMEEIQRNKPMSEQEKLQSALDDAVRREDYEKAAEFRDALKLLQQKDN